MCVGRGVLGCSEAGVAPSGFFPVYFRGDDDLNDADLGFWDVDAESFGVVCTPVI